MFGWTDPVGAVPFLGAIAQLGERVLCKHEVVGSIPSGSTIAADFEVGYPVSKSLRALTGAHSLKS